MDKETAEKLADMANHNAGNTVEKLMEDFKAPEDYTKDDFLKGIEPYQYCCLYLEDKFEFERQKNILSDIARSRGVKNFVTLLNKYCQQHDIDIDESNVTNFPDQPLTLRCGGYICDFSGVKSDGEIICPHPIMPVMRLINIDTGIEKVKIAYSRGKGWRYIIVDRKTISTANKIVDLSDCGIAVTSESAKALVRYFAKLEQLNPDFVQEMECVTRLGWIEQGEELQFSPYVNDITFDGEADYKRHYESVKPHGSFEKWLNLVDTEIRQKSVIARIVFAASLASVLVKPLGCNCFWLHLWGETESAKTVMAMVAASIWGNPEIGCYITTFNATCVGMEKTAAFYNNLPYILDELQIINDKKDLDNLIYMLTEGSGRSRGNKQGGLDAVPKWKNAVITTGERPISTARSGGGAVNRVLEVECKEKFFTDPRFVANTVKANYGIFGKMFIAKLEADGFDEAEKLLSDYQKRLVDDHNIMQKQAQSAALILTADTLITRLLGDDRALTCEEIAEFLKTKDDVSVNPRAYEYVCEFVAANQARFTYDPERPGEIWGSFNGDSVYIIKNKFNQICDEGGYNPQALISYLADKRLIERQSGKNTVIKRIGGVLTRCIHITLMAEAGENEEDYGF